MIENGLCDWIQLFSSISDLSKGNEISIALLIISLVHKLYVYIKNYKVVSNNNKPKGMSSIGHSIVINGQANIIYNVYVSKN
jgi:hypothetical protein